MLEANPRASRTVPFVAKATGVPLVEHAVRLLLGEPLAALGLPERATPSRAWAKEAVFPGRALPGRGHPRARDALDRRGDGRRGNAGRGLRASASRRRPVAPRRDDRPAAPGLGAIVGGVREILEAIGEATAAGEQVVVATVIDTIRSAPRQPGAKMAVRESGRFVGSVSGGCVEADVVEHARQIFAGEAARRVHYGVTDGEAWEVGLSCGGEIDVWVEQADPGFWQRGAGDPRRGRLRDALRRTPSPARSGSSAACSRAPASATTESSPRSSRALCA